MTVSTELSHEEYVGNGVTTDFDFRFRIFESRHLIVVVADNDGNETTLKNGTDYFIVGVGSYFGGKVVLSKPLAKDWKILLERDLPVVQETDLRNQGKFFAEVHEDAFDYLTMLIQKALGNFSLSLRKPTYLSNYYDAKGNRIANLAPPKVGTDAANKDYVDNNIKDIDSKTLRVKDKPINVLPNTEQRANKILAFDDNGQPITVLPESGSASDVLIELSKPTGASLLGSENGYSVQHELNNLSNKTMYLYDLFDFVKITDYEDLVDGDDWTNAIQAALDSGKPVYGRGIYKVSGKLKSKGQKLIGKWFINATHLHHTFNKIPATVELTEKNHIRTIYTDMAYDLCELLAMKSLGFNIISHYCDFNAHDSGRGGSVDILLDNALSAGMYVALNTETAINSINLNITLEEYISKYDNHPSVWGYSVYDEPATRKISVADQDAKIEKLRKLTSKPLTCVDLVVDTCPPFFENWSKNYDVFFVDSYAQHYEIDKISDMFALDCEKHRLDFGGVKAMSGCLKLVPVVGLFTSTEGQYSRNNQQIINSAKFFGTKGGGDYGAFVWGFPWNSTGDDRIQNSANFQTVCVELSNQPITGVLPETNCYIFGGFPNYHDYGLSQVLNVLPVKDPNNITLSPWSDSFPTNNRVGDLIYSGIGFKAASSIFQTSIEVKKYVSVYFDCFHMNGMNENTTLQLQLYKGGDLTMNATDKMNIKNKPTFFTSNKWTPATHGENLLLSIENNKVTNKYELLIRGLIVCTNW
ncbi:hypothetical protein I4674_00180 [Proteus mirabilis]|nr:hypothetical protein [Proteus mirabilis]